MCRFFHMEGVYNLRCLGGYPGACGRLVKRNIFFRSDDLGAISPESVNLLNNMNIKSVIDFRDEKEIASAPDILPSSVQSVFYLNIPVGSLVTEDAAKDSFYDIMILASKLFVDRFQDIFAKFFKIISSFDNLPVLFHCSAGKDRTGFAAAMLLSALGVDRNTIFEDYMLSKKPIEIKYKSIIENNPSIYPLFTVDRSYLETSFSVIDRDYGGVDKYLKNNLHVDIELLRYKYLEK